MILETVVVEKSLKSDAGNALIFIHFLKQRTRAFTKLLVERGDGLIWGAGNALTFFHQYVFFHDATKMWKKKLIRKHDHESWNFRSESEPILNRLLNSFAAEPCPHWENWQHFRRPKWAHFERVPWPRPVFARVQKSWKKHIKTNAFWTVYWIVLMNLGWRVGDV